MRAITSWSLRYLVPARRTPAQAGWTAGAARFLATALAAASLAFFAAPPSAANSVTTFRGSERYQVQQVFAESSPVQISVVVDDAGNFVVGIDDELWVGRVVGTGRDSRVEMTAEQLAGIQATIARDLEERYASQFVPRIEHRRLADMEVRAAEIGQERAGLQAAYDDAKARVASYLQGAIILPDILKALNDARDAAKAALDGKVNEAGLHDAALQQQRARTEPRIVVVLGAMTLTFRFDRTRTTVRVRAKLFFDARSEFEEQPRHGRRTISGRGPLTP